MKKFLKHLLCMLCTIHITACATRQYIEQYDDIEGFNAGEKGIVVLQSVHRSEMINSEVNGLSTTWRNVDSNKFFVANPRDSTANFISTIATFGIVYGVFNYDTMIFFIEPGIYSLSDVAFANKYAYNLKDIMKFKVSGGEVIYLGKIVVSDDSKIVANALNIEDQYETTKKYFATKYPQINKVPEKRLINFTSRSKVVKDISKNFGILE